MRQSKVLWFAAAPVTLTDAVQLVALTKPSYTTCHVVAVGPMGAVDWPPRFHDLRSVGHLQFDSAGRTADLKRLMFGLRYSKEIEMAPADSPNTVTCPSAMYVRVSLTLELSPPKAQILSCTHCKVASWSFKPRLAALFEANSAPCL